jgi:peptidyl-prolyl cis-trans isomerase B (cyclophilin B)
VAGKDRKKELARQRFERQQQRREAQQRQAQRVKIIGGVAAVVVLGGAGAAVAFAVSGKDKTTTTTPTTAAAAAVKPGECSYTAAADKGAPTGLGTPSVKPLYNGDVKATIKTNLGDIGLTLDGAKAPCATNSFAFLAKQKFFDKTSCHRLSTGTGLQMLQCGDPTGTGQGGPGYKFANENTSGAKYTKGVLAMANAGPGTNGSQFFIVYGDSQLSPDYTIFGKVTSGLGVVQDVAKAGSDGKNPDGTGAPKKKITFEGVTVTQ